MDGCLFSLSNFIFDLNGFHLKKKLKNQYDLLTGVGEEYLVVNNKDNRVFNYVSELGATDGCPLEI